MMFIYKPLLLYKSACFRLFNQCLHVYFSHSIDFPHANAINLEQMNKQKAGSAVGTPKGGNSKVGELFPAASIDEYANLNREDEADDVDENDDEDNICDWRRKFGKLLHHLHPYIIIEIAQPTMQWNCAENFVLNEYSCNVIASQFCLICQLVHRFSMFITMMGTAMINQCADVLHILSNDYMWDINYQGLLDVLWYWKTYYIYLIV